MARREEPGVSNPTDYVRRRVDQIELELVRLADATPEELSEATKAPPGSPAKLALLCMREAAGLPLWHDDDKVFKPHAGRQADPLVTRGVVGPGHRHNGKEIRIVRN